MPLNQESSYHPFWWLTGLEAIAAFSSGGMRGIFSDFSGIIPDVVEMRSQTRPPFIALVRYKIAKLMQETIPAQKSAFFLFLCFLFICFALLGFLIGWVLVFWFFFQQEVAHLGFARARP